MITAKVIADSTSWLNIRLTTFVLEYPRYVHSELLTHRVFSKNSSSSRAIPYTKMVANILADSVVPKWTWNEKGMQGKLVEEGSIVERLATNKWLETLDLVITKANEINEIGIHKQNVNRLLEPWMHIRVILTGTDFDNWFKLRDHKDAQPEIQELARAMKVAMEASTPKYLKTGEWHLPFGDNIEFDEVVSFDHNQNYENNINRLKISVARCARISYNNWDGSNSTIQKDIELFDKLIVQEPLHASPAEHQAKVPREIELGFFTSRFEKFDKWAYRKAKYVSNLTGWIQLRKLIENGEFK